MKREFGFAITSTDRPDCLSKLLFTIQRWSKNLNNIYVFDDSSMYKDKNEEICRKYGFPLFIDTGKRIGISANTNKCIEYMYNKFPYFLVMNNDVEIIRGGWETFYLNAMKITGIHHFCFRQYGLFGACQMGHAKTSNSKPDVLHDVKGIKIATIKDYFSNGVILTFDTKLVDKVGYFDEELFPSYGRGHNDYTNRVSMSGIQAPGIHDVYGSNEYFKVSKTESVTPSKKRREDFLKADKNYKSVCNDNTRIYISSPIRKQQYPKKTSHTNPYTISNNQLNFSKNEEISIILTAYKTQDYIEEALDSIENQTYFKNNNNYEILLGVDGCFETLEKVKSIRHKYRNLRVFMMDKNVGTYVTSNTMLSLCKYDNIIRFDTDDIMFDHMVDTVMLYLKTYDYIRFGFCDFYDTIKETKPRKLKAFGICAYNRSVIKKVGGYKSWPCSADVDFYNRVEKSCNVKLVNEILFYRRRHDNSLTSNLETGCGTPIRKKYDDIIRNKKNYTFSNYKIDPKISTYTEIKLEKDIFIKEPRPLIIYNLASYNREDSLELVVNSILPQCDQLRVYLNCYSSIPKYLYDPSIVYYTSQEYGDCGDIGKFHDCDNFKDCYYFTIDDDIFYPKNYSDKLIDKIEKYDRKHVVGVHGVDLLRRPILDYYKDRKVYHFKKELLFDKPVDILGTGTVAYFSNSIEIYRSDFKKNNMADIWFSCKLERNNIKRICVEREIGWLNPIELRSCQVKTIHDTAKKKGWGKLQAEIINKDFKNE